MANGALGFKSTSHLALTDRFEIIKEVGDGSFGSVVLAKVRSAGSNIAKRGSVVSFLIFLSAGSLISSSHRSLSKR